MGKTTTWLFGEPWLDCVYEGLCPPLGDGLCFPITLVKHLKYEYHNLYLPMKRNHGQSPIWSFCKWASGEKAFFSSLVTGRLSISNEVSLERVWNAFVGTSSILFSPVFQKIKVTMCNFVVVINYILFIRGQ